MAKKSQKKFSARSTIDEKEIGQFDALGQKWWDESGPMRPLHRLSPVRMGYLKNMICARFGLDGDSPRALEGLTIADIGCGGGLVAEPLARLGAAVTGIDAGAGNIRVAAAHAAGGGLDIDYRAMTAEDLAASGAQFDVVTALEIVEHVADVPLFLQSCAALVRPGGLLIVSTLNRTAKSFALGIVAAEYLLRWLPRGTHDWRKFLKPSEIAAVLEPAGLEVTDVTGLVFRPVTGRFALSKADLSVNYFITAVHEGE